MPQILFYDRGVARFKPGNLTRSDSRQVNCLYPFVANPFATVSVAAAASFPVNTTTSFSITINNTGETFSFPVIVGATFDIEVIRGFLLAGLPGRYSVSTAGATYKFDTSEPGFFGNFTIAIGSGTPVSSTVPLTPAIAVGRLLLPVTDNIDLNVPQYDSQTRYRLPVVSDLASQFFGCVISLLDAHTNTLRLPNQNDNGLITGGTTFGGLRRGTVILSPTSVVPPGTATLHVHCLTAGLELAGRLTVTPTVTTIPVPPGILRINTGSTQAAQNIEVEKFEY